MSKVLKSIGEIVGGIALALLSGPIGIGIFTSLEVTNAMISVGLGAALTGVSGLIHKNSPTATSTLQGNQLNIRQPISYREIVYGSVRKGGVLAFIGTSGSKNEFLHLIILLAGHQVNSISTANIYLNGSTIVPLTSDGSGHFVPFSSDPFNGLILAEFHNGDPSDTSQPFPQLASDLPSQWTSTDLIRGVAKVHLRLKFDSTQFSGGVSTFTFDVEGRQLFDSRTSTTVYANNTALALRDWWFDNTYGMALGDPTLVDDTCTNAAANICDEDVALRGGGTQKRYAANGVFDASQARGDVIKGLLSSMMGTCVPPGDAWRMFAGAFRDSVADLTDDDLRGPIKFDTRVSRANLANAISGTFISPANNWQPSDFPAYKSSSYVEEDGGEEIWKDLTLPFETDGIRAQRLAKIYLELLRRSTPLSLPCKLTESAFEVEPGDVCTFTHSRWGFDAKTFLVFTSSFSQQAGSDSALDSSQSNSNSDVPALGVDLVLYPFDSNAFFWDPDTDEGTVDAPGTPLLPDSSSVSPPDGFSLLSNSSTTVLRADGIAHSQIKATWDALNDPSIAGVEVYVAPSGGTFYLDGVAAPTDTVYFISKNLNDGTTYDVQLKCVNLAGAHSTPVSGSVTCSGTSSTITADIGGARYSSGATIDSLEPAEFGAQVTAGKSIDILSDGSTYARTLSSGLNSGFAHKTSTGHFIKGVGDTQTLSLDDEIDDGSTYVRFQGVERTRNSASGNLIMNGGFEFGDARNWNSSISPPEHNQAFEAMSSITAESDASEGGFVGRTQGDSGHPGIYTTSYVIPVDTSKSYAISCRIGQGGSTNTNLFLGIICYDENKEVIPNSIGSTYTYCLAQDISTHIGFTTFNCIIGGGEEAFNGTDGYHDVTKFRAGTKYITPLILQNESLVSGDVHMVVDYFKIVVATDLDKTTIDGSTYARTLSAGLDSGYAHKISTGHLIKGVGDSQTLSLDNEIDDGSTYGRTLLDGLNSGYPNKTSTSHLIKGVGDSQTLSLESEITDGSTRSAMTGANSSYRPLSNPLSATDSGSSITVLIAAFTMRVPGRSDISVSSGTVAGLSYGTLYYIYYDDASYAGGSVTYHATTVKETAINASGRFYLGSIMTPPATGADTVGNNDGGAGAQLGGILINYPTAGVSGTLSGTGTVNITAGGFANVFDHDATTDCEITAGGVAQRSFTFSGFSSLSFASLYAVRLIVEHEMTSNDTSGNPVVVTTTIPGASSILHASSFSRIRESLTLPLPLPPVFSILYSVAADASGHTTVAKLYDMHIEELF